MKARILAYLASARSGAADVDRPVLYAIYGNDLIVRLARIHAHPERGGPSGSLVVALHGRSPGYVRCTFKNDGEILECEAVAGDYPPRAGQSLPMDRSTMEEALRAVGYWRDEATGRFLFPFEIGPEPTSDEWGGASVVILDPLISVFGARAGSKIDIVAPLAPQRDEAAILREVRGR